MADPLQQGKEQPIVRLDKCVGLGHGRLPYPGGAEETLAIKSSAEAHEGGCCQLCEKKVRIQWVRGELQECELGLG